MFMSKLFSGGRTFLHPIMRPFERLVYKLCGVSEDVEQRWTEYAASLIAFSVASFTFAYLIQRFQGYLPFNPQGFGTGHAPAGSTAITPDLAFNTAVSFLTNTNWQSYSGESTFGYFVQMSALTVQNFVSGAAGIAIAIALVRGFARQQKKTIGNFWVDLTRGVLYLLLPLSLIGALFLCSQGVIQNFKAYDTKSRPSKEQRRSSRKGRSLRRKPSKWWGQTGAVSSTQIQRTRLRIPLHSQTSFR